jgi:hypothetical protein
MTPTPATPSGGTKYPTITGSPRNNVMFILYAMLMALAGIIMAWKFLNG